LKRSPDDELSSSTARETSSGLQGDSLSEMLITFSGLDGAGKTTLIAELTQELESRGRSVTRFTNYEDVGLLSAIRRFRRRHGWLPTDDAAPRSDTVKHPAIRGTLQATRHVLHGRLVTGLLLPLDLLLFMVRRRRVTSDVLILDRYFYDSLIELRLDSTWWGRRFQRLLPAPHIAVFVDVDPAVAFARKGEHGVAELARRERAYRRLFSQLPHVVTIRNESLDVAKRQLFGAVFDTLSCQEWPAA
jgi:thymidylate kinase